MPRTQAAILTFPAESYEDAESIAGRLTKAGFEPSTIYIEGSGQDHEVALHAKSADRSRAHRAVYGSRYVAMLALAGGLTALGAAFWAMRPRQGPASRGRKPQHAPQQRLRGAAQFTTTHLTADQAVPDHPDGFLVLNGDADGPATTIEQDSGRRDVRARDEAEAASALDGRFGGVRLIEHEFPDASGQGSHWVKVWVPDYPAART
jgi:hypothetical protein